MIGHASLLVETADRCILMDPVLGPSHQEGLHEVFPARRVELSRMPAIDTLFISHRHLDHFDLPSLARLPRDVQVLVPHDSLLLDCLERLGFERIVPLRPFSKVTLGETTLLTTGSRAPIAELGVVIADPTAVVWNMVDTIVSPEVIAVVRSRFPQIDVLLATWQPLLEDVPQGGSTAFPHAFYEQLLTHVGLVEPSVVVPGSCGYRHVGAAAWLDRVAFPVTRERFCADVVRVRPELEGMVLTMDPGDVLEKVDDTVTLHEGGCPFVEAEPHDRGVLDFAPVLAAAAALVDDAEDHDLERLEAAVERFVTEDLVAFVASDPPRFALHRAWDLRYQLAIAFPGGRWRTWGLDFTCDEVTAMEGRQPLANFSTYVTASGLQGLLEGRHGWNRLVLGGHYRTFQCPYVPTPAGLVRPSQAPIPDPLRMRLPDATTFEHARLAELERCLENDAHEAALD